MTSAYLTKGNCNNQRIMKICPGRSFFISYLPAPRVLLVDNARRNGVEYGDYSVLDN